jgi:hypothetical protein
LRSQTIIHTSNFEIYEIFSLYKSSDSRRALPIFSDYFPFNISSVSNICNILVIK